MNIFFFEKILSHKGWMVSNSNTQACLLGMCARQSVLVILKLLKNKEKSKKIKIILIVMSSPYSIPPVVFILHENMHDLYLKIVWPFFKNFFTVYILFLFWFIFYFIFSEDILFVKKGIIFISISIYVSIFI